MSKYKLKKDLEIELKECKEKAKKNDDLYWNLYDRKEDVGEYLRAIRAMDTEMTSQDYKRIFEHLEIEEYRD